MTVKTKFANLTVDYRKMLAVPIQDRVQLARSSAASEIFGNMSPTEIARLFPSFYQKSVPGVAGLLGTGTAATTGYSGGGSSGGQGGKNGGSSGSNGQSKAAPYVPPTVLESLIQGANAKKFGTSSTPGQRKLMDLIASGEGGYNSSNGGTRNGQILYSTNSAMRNGKRLQDMTIGEIEQYMDLPIGHPDRLFAVGKFQLTKTGAWPGAVRELGLKKTDVLTPELQEKMGIYAVMQKRPAVARYIRGESDDIVEAHKQLALEFASIPVPVGMNVEGKYRPAGASAYGSGNRSAHGIDEVQQALMQARQEALAQKNGSDVKVEKLITATPTRPKKKMVLSMGSNDWSDPKNTYKNTVEAISNARKKGYDVVLIPPNGNSPKLKAAYDEVMRAATDTGVTVDRPLEYSGDGIHPNANEYKRLGQQYSGAVVVGDSIAVGIGQHVQDGQTVAKEGISTNMILSSINSPDVASLETEGGSEATATPSVTITPENIGTVEGLDPRIASYVETLNPDQKSQFFSAVNGIGNVDEINQLAKSGLERMGNYNPQQTASVNVSRDIDQDPVAFWQARNPQNAQIADVDIESLRTAMMAAIKLEADESAKGKPKKVEIYGAQSGVRNNPSKAGSKHGINFKEALDVAIYDVDPQTGQKLANRSGAYGNYSNKPNHGGIDPEGFALYHEFGQNQELARIHLDSQGESGYSNWGVRMGELFSDTEHDFMHTDRSAGVDSTTGVSDQANPKGRGSVAEGMSLAAVQELGIDPNSEQGQRLMLGVTERYGDTKQELSEAAFNAYGPKNPHVQTLPDGTTTDAGVEPMIVAQPEPEAPATPAPTQETAEQPELSATPTPEQPAPTPPTEDVPAMAQGGFIPEKDNLSVVKEDTGETVAKINEGEVQGGIKAEGSGVRVESNVSRKADDLVSKIEAQSQPDAEPVKDAQQTQPPLNSNQGSMVSNTPSQSSQHIGHIPYNNTLGQLHGSLSRAYALDRRRFGYGNTQ